MSQQYGTYPVGGYSGVYFPDAAASPPAPWPPASVRPRRRRRGRRITILSVAVGMLSYIMVRVVLSVGVHDLLDAVPSNAGAVSHAGDLRALLVPAPVGSKPWAHPLGTGEQYSAEQDAQLADKPSARLAGLREYHFTRGAVRCWNENGTVVAVVLLQFDSPADAARFTAADQRGTSQAHPNAVTGKPAGVPHAVNVLEKVPDVDGYLEFIAIGQRGDAEIVVVVGHQPPGRLDRLDEILQQQYARL